MDCGVNSCLDMLFAFLAHVIYIVETINALQLLTPASYTYIPVIPPPAVNISTQSQFCFSVEICNDAHILLGQDAVDFSNGMYEIVIGGWANRKSVVRKSRQGTNLEITQHASGPLSCSEFRHFYISWDGGQVTVGSVTGDAMGQPFLTYSDPSPVTVNFIFVSGWNRYGVWNVDFACGSTTPSSLETTTDRPTIQPDSTVQTNIATTFENKEVTSEHTSTKESTTGIDNMQTSSGTAQTPGSSWPTDQDFTSLVTTPGSQETTTDHPKIQPDGTVQTNFDNKEVTTEYTSTNESTTGIDNMQTTSAAGQSPGCSVDHGCSKRTSHARHGPLCSCQCAFRRINKTLPIRQKVLDEIVSTLLIPSNATSARQRRFISVPDERTSSTAIGFTGIVCLVTTVLFVVCFDLMTFIK